jgi:hypothetical protein
MTLLFRICRECIVVILASTAVASATKIVKLALVKPGPWAIIVEARTSLHAGKRVGTSGRDQKILLLVLLSRRTTGSQIAKQHPILPNATMPQYAGISFSRI